MKHGELCDPSFKNFISHFVFGFSQSPGITLDS